MQDQIEFRFTDVDMDKGEVAGNLVLKMDQKLKPSGAVNYVVYWSDSDDDSGKGPKLTETSINFSGVILHRVPSDTVIPAGKGDYFLLYLSDGKGKEIFSGKSASVIDKFTEVQQDTKPDVVEPDKPEVVEPEVVEPEVVEPEIVEPIKPDVVEPEAEKDYKSVIVIKNVLFEFDKSQLRPSFKKTLQEDFADLEDKSQKEILIAGHADERGSNEYNLALGERRAYAVKQYLISLGFYANNVKIISYGEEKPLDPSHSEEAWSKNRRAETKVKE